MFTCIKQFNPTNEVILDVDTSFFQSIEGCFNLFLTIYDIFGSISDLEPTLIFIHFDTVVQFYILNIKLSFCSFETNRKAFVYITK